MVWMLVHSVLKVPKETIDAHKVILASEFRERHGVAAL